MRSVLAALLVALVVLGLPATAAEAGSPAGRYAVEAHRETNAQRADADLSRLQKDRCLRRMALRHAKAMSERGELFHQNLRRVQRRCDMGWVGENVGVGFKKGALVVKAWMRSPGHRANILTRQFRRMGIAGYRHNGVWWVAQVFGTRA